MSILGKHSMLSADRYAISRHDELRGTNVPLTELFLDNTASSEATGISRFDQSGSSGSMNAHTCRAANITTERPCRIREQILHDAKAARIHIYKTLDDGSPPRDSVEGGILSCAAHDEAQAARQLRE